MAALRVEIPTAAIDRLLGIAHKQKQVSIPPLGKRPPQKALTGSVS